MSQPTLDQRRAQHAWSQLTAFADRNAPKGRDPKAPDRRSPNDAAKKYGVHARKLPMRIMASGLGQALAFLHAKNYCPDLLTALADWVLYQRKGAGGAARGADELLRAVVAGDSEFAQLATAEVLAYLRWLTRFVEAEGLTDSDGGD